jgi:hypothetical protein
MGEPVGEQELLDRDPLDDGGLKFPATDDEQLTFRKEAGIPYRDLASDPDRLPARPPPGVAIRSGSI